MSRFWTFIMMQALQSPVTGDRFRPWIAAVILILSVVVLVALFLVRKHGDSEEDA